MSFLRKHSRLFLQVFAGIAVIVVVVIMVAVRFVRVKTLSVLMAQEEALASSQMDGASNVLSRVFDNAYSDIDLLMFDPDIIALSQSSAAFMNYAYYTQVKSVYSRLFTLTATNSYIQSIYVYLGTNGYIGTDVTNSTYAHVSENVPLFRSSFYRRLVEKPYHVILSTDLSSSDFHIYKVEALHSGGNNRLISVCSVAGKGSGAQLIVINLNTQKVSQLMDALFGEETPAWMLDTDGSIIISNSAARAHNFRELRLQDEGLFNGSGKADAMLSTMPGRVVYNQGGSAGFTFVKFIPLEANDQEISRISNAFLLTFLICTVIVLFFVWLWTRKCLQPIRILRDKMSGLENGQLGTQIDVIPRNELGDLSQHFNRMSTALSEMDRQKQKSNALLRDLEIKALRAQINPHFLFNTLNMLKWMAIQAKTPDLEKSIVALAEILRPAFRNTEAVAPLRSEIFTLSQYIIILSHRFGNQVNLQIDLPPSLENQLVPRFLMQPIIENSVSHGRYADGRCLTICVSALTETGVLVLTVSDNGQGMEEKQLNTLNASFHMEGLSGAGDSVPTDTSAHVGLLNIHRRIVLMYGAEYGVHVESRLSQGTTVRICLPCKT